MDEQELDDPNYAIDYYSDLFEFFFYVQCVITWLLTFIYDQLAVDYQWLYPPLLTSIGISAFLGQLWKWFTPRNPSRAIWVVFRLSPSFTSLLGLLVLIAGCFNCTASHVAALFTILCSIILFFYGIRVKPKFDRATLTISHGTQFSPPGEIALLLLSIFIGIVYTCMFVVFLERGKFIRTVVGDFIFVLAMMASQFWTMQVIRNAMLVAVSRVVYNHYTKPRADPELNAFYEFWDNTVINCRRSICFGSIVVPIIEFVHGLLSAVLNLNLDYFLEPLIRSGNWWGFVEVGAHNNGIVGASMDARDLLYNDLGLKEVIGWDRTGSFCLFSGIAGGAVCSLVSGGWALIVHKSFDLEIALYSFLIGYYMVWIAMASTHASVLAYFVANAANLHAGLQSLAIPTATLIEQLQRLQIAEASEVENQKKKKNKKKKKNNNNNNK